MPYTVTVNASGYLPEQEPIECTSWENAKETLINELNYTIEGLGEATEDAFAEELAAVKSDLEHIVPSNYSWTLCGLVHSINKLTSITKEEALAAMRLCVANPDKEVGHVDADRVLCDFLEGLGHADLVELFHKVDMWYA